MNNQVTGKLHKVLEIESGTGGKGKWEKQSFIVETNDQYPKKICIELWGEKVKDLTKFQPGQDVKVSFNAESREYNGKWFTTLRAWKIEALSGTVSADNGSVSTVKTPVDDSEDLPF